MSETVVTRRDAKFHKAATVLVADAQQVSRQLHTLMLAKQYHRAETLAAALQSLARDVKWLMRRLPKD